MAAMMFFARRQIHVALVCCGVVAIWPQFAYSQQPAQWPRWRGATGQGIATDAALPMVWPKNMEPDWTAKLGTGWSSPVVADGRVFVTDRVEASERVLAFDARTGRELWKRSD